MASVVMYTKKICPFCVRAKGLLKSKGADITEISIEGSNDLREEMLNKSNGSMTVPQIFIGDLHVGGCDDLFALDARGELDTLLK
ncbi:glutaredoxin 3 [Thiospirochaeta perfilievii]|uniref:Glutaredoxin n=1 Tax=Thiospirochaeta perfilievii TaxID=252967 RepID=A0A5C1QD63_9SPIO|nr:glutaredoxin 3 [Thiospirochaeta perfilievii]QEN04576.1 glutaredoxin 3 [Thiospirochaeta perfilievii]